MEQTDDLERHASIATDLAGRLAQAALDHAREHGVRISVAVVDRGGHLLAFLRDGRASFHSASIAMDKAYTAASFGAPSGGLGRALHGMGPVVFHGLLERPRLAAFGGGFPLRRDGETIGAIGVSGGTAEEDENCALAALKAAGFHE